MSSEKEIAVTDNHELDQDTIEEIRQSHDDPSWTNFSQYHTLTNLNWQVLQQLKS